MSHYSSAHFDPKNANTPWYKIFKLVKKGTVVLDVGCAAGALGTELIDHKECIVDGLEYDKGDVVRARKHLRTVLQGNIETMNLGKLKPGSYDYIVFSDVIEHLVDPVATLRKIKPLLKEKGKVLFSIPNMAHISVRLELINGNFEYGNTGLLDKTHLHFYDEGEVRRVFYEAGYTLPKFEYIERDLPRGLIEKELKKIGLSGSDKFFKAMSDPRVSAYQFIGAASPSVRPPKIERRTESPDITIMSHYVNNLEAGYMAQIKTLEEELRQARSFSKLEKVKHYFKRSK